MDSQSQLASCHFLSWAGVPVVDAPGLFHLPSGASATPTAAASAVLTSQAGTRPDHREPSAVLAELSRHLAPPKRQNSTSLAWTLCPAAGVLQLADTKCSRSTKHALTVHNANCSL